MTAAGVSPGTASGSRAASQTLVPTLAACACRRPSDVAPEAALGHVDDAQQALRVAGVREQREVGEHVADLGALVELGPADDLVGDRVAAELLFEHARLGVGAVEDGDLVRRVGALGAGARLALEQLLTSLATNCASARSSLTSTLAGAPSPRGVQRLLPLRSGCG